MAYLFQRAVCAASLSSDNSYGFSHNAGDITVQSAGASVRRGDPSAQYWIIEPSANFSLPPISDLIAADQWRVFVATDWAARSSAGATATWNTHGSEEIIGSFPASGNEWVELIADANGNLNPTIPGDPCWYIVSTAPVTLPAGIGVIAIGSTFIIN